MRSVTGTAVVRLAAMAASFAVGIQLARGLGAAGYGYYGMALAVITIATIPVEMGLPRLVTREVAASLAHKNIPAVFGVLRWADRVSSAVSAVVMAGVVIGALVVRGRTGAMLSSALVVGTPMILLLTLARIRGGALQGLSFIVRGQVPDILARPLLLSVLIFLFPVSGGELTPAAAMALNSLTAAVVLIVAQAWLKRRLPARPAETERNGRQWLAISVPIGLTDGMRVLQSELSLLILGLIVAPAQVGLFRIANVTSFAAATPVAMISFVAFPVIARLYAERDMERLQKALTRLAQVQFAGVFLLCLPLFLFAGPLLKLVFGAEYSGAADALRILAAAQVITSAFGVNSAVLNMTRHERKVTRAMFLALVLNLAALPVLAHFWGEVGAAIAVAAALTLWNVLNWLDARRMLRLETSVLPPAWIGLGRRPAAPKGR